MRASDLLIMKSFHIWKDFTWTQIILTWLLFYLQRRNNTALKYNEHNIKRKEKIQTGRTPQLVKKNLKKSYYVWYLYLFLLEMQYSSGSD